MFQADYFGSSWFSVTDLGGLVCKIGAQVKIYGISLVFLLNSLSSGQFNKFERNYFEFHSRLNFVNGIPGAFNEEPGIIES